MAPKKLIESEPLWRQIVDRYDGFYSGGMGAESIKDLLIRLDLDAEMERLQEDLSANSAQKRQRVNATAEGGQAFLGGQQLASGHDPGDGAGDSSGTARWSSSTAAVSPPPT